MLDKEVGARIKYLRETNRYTREAFADKIGISSKFLYEIETGRKGFSANTLLRISQTLSVSCDYILCGHGGKNKISQEIRDILESMDPGQMERVKDIMSLVRDISKKNKYTTK